VTQEQRVLRPRMFGINLGPISAHAQALVRRMLRVVWQAAWEQEKRSGFLPGSSRPACAGPVLCHCHTPTLRHPPHTTPYAGARCRAGGVRAVPAGGGGGGGGGLRPLGQHIRHESNVPFLRRDDE